MFRTEENIKKNDMIEGNHIKPKRQIIKDSGITLISFVINAK